MTVEAKERERAKDRLAVLERIEEYERRGWFDRDAEEDPPAPILYAKDTKYLDKSFLGSCKRAVAFGAARLFFREELRKKKLYLSPAEGIENLASIEGGCVITCNHFHPYDSFMMQKVFDASKRRGRMYRVIREGNYTAFPGFYGMLMRNCDTLPLSSDPAAMKLFLKAVRRSLAAGDALLVYAEQSLWWNYRKPKPLKLGAFEMAVRSAVPVVPCFITFTDTDRIGEDGFPVLAYTPHIGAPIYPDLTLPKKEAAEKMRAENEQFAKSVYERVYGKPLVYTTQKE